MQNKIIILGAGGHAKVIADIILCAGNELVGFLDDKKEGNVLGLPILGKMGDISSFQEQCSFVIGIGDNQTRRRIAEEYSLNWHTAVHPSVVIAKDVVIGKGTVVMTGAIINPSTTIGKHCIINTGAVIEHDNIIDDYVHISPNATLCGTVRVEAGVHIGAGAIVKNNTYICNDVVIGAGGVVVRDITEAGTYVGVPACRSLK